jgi:hypothetical protein
MNAELYKKLLAAIKNALKKSTRYYHDKMSSPDEEHVRELWQYENELDWKMFCVSEMKWGFREMYCMRMIRFGVSGLNCLMGISLIYLRTSSNCGLCFHG